MNPFSRQGGREIQQRSIEALTSLANELGLDVVAAGGSIGATEMTLKFRFKTRDVDALEDQKRKEFASKARFIGLQPDDYGLEFIMNGRHYRLTGANTRAPKFPIYAENLVDGRTYKLTRATIPWIEQAREKRQETQRAAALADQFADTAVWA